MKEKFIGTWNLAHWDLQRVDGTHYSYPYGKDVKGMIIYTIAGRMTALLMKLERPNFKVPHSWKGTTEEVKAAFTGYTSYAGTFKIENNTVVHQVDMSLLPNWIGTDLVRNFEFKTDGKLLLSTLPFALKNGVVVKQCLLWEKMG